MVFNSVLETIKDKVLPQFSGATVNWMRQMINIWKEQTVKNLLDGKVVISDTVINDYLIQTSSAKIPEIRVHAKEDNSVGVGKADAIVQQVKPLGEQNCPDLGIAGNGFGKKRKGPIAGFGLGGINSAFKGNLA